jgi:multidrug efflux system membrane fusion protein
MAVRRWIWVPVVAVVVIAGSAYATRDRWLPDVEVMLGLADKSASPSTATVEPTAGRRGNGRRGQRQGAGQIPTPVLVAEVKTENVPVYIDGVGSVKPLNSVTVRPEVSGKLVAINFTEGQDVRKGDVLARIDDAVYRATLEQALGKIAQDQALLHNAELDLDRYQKLLQSSSGTQQQVDTARSQVAQYRATIQSDQAAIDSARASLDYTTIKAPIDGRTGIRNVDVGNIVGPSDSTGIVTLSQIRPISVLFSIPQQQLGRINAAMGLGVLSVQAITGADNVVIDDGHLAVVDNQVDATTGTVKLKADFPNEKLALWPGAFVNARLLVETLKDVLVIPTAAVQRGPDGTFVYVVTADSTVAMRKVKVAQQDDVRAIIDDGAAAGDKVVTTGFARLQDGAKVTVSSPAQPQGAAAAADASPNAAHNGSHRRQQNGDGGTGSGQPQGGSSPATGNAPAAAGGASP